MTYNPVAAGEQLPSPSLILRPVKPGVCPFEGSKCGGVVVCIFTTIVSVLV